MTDRELLEKAAKAAGYVIESFRSNGGAWCYPIDEQPDEDGDHPGLFPWHPIDDDGDALRLAVRLFITPHIDCNLTEAEWAGQDAGGFIAEPHIDDRYAATRRAITRAAAEIGGSHGLA